MEYVSLVRIDRYELSELRDAVQRLLEPIGGIGAFVSRGDRVLIKPNMLAAKSPELAVTTHPALVRVVADLAGEAGGKVFIGDSPGYGAFLKVAERTGILDAAAASGAELVEFEDAIELKGVGTFRLIRIARAYYEADVVINLPKLKTHEMMTLTCAVKNTFGAVVGHEKAAWHMKAGSSRETFARLLLEICHLKKPALNIVDAIWGMEGNGPGSGDPIKVGLLIAGANPVAVDFVAARVAGIPEELLYVEREAREMGMKGVAYEEIAIRGIRLEEVVQKSFKLPDGLDTQFGLPRIVPGIFKKHLTSYPEAVAEMCVLCGVCRDACPPGAITIKQSALSVDSALCIRCWCCRELCPHNAMKVSRSRMLRLIDFIRPLLRR